MTTRPPERDASGPTPDELLVMAYVDGELDATERARLEARFAREPALAAELASQRRLGLLAREMAPREPEDHEWARIEASAHGGALRWSTWALVVLLPLAAIVALEAWCWSPTTSPLVRWSVTVLVALAIAAFVLTWAARWRARRYDPYTGVRR